MKREDLYLIYNKHLAEVELYSRLLNDLTAAIYVDDIASINDLIRRTGMQWLRVLDSSKRSEHLTDGSWENER